MREWCLGNMEAEENSTFVSNIVKWLGGISSFGELNRRLPDVATAIHDHDTTGMTESFSDIANRLKSIFIEISQGNYAKENTYNVLVVTHAFVIKTLFYLFAPEQLSMIEKVKNVTISQLKFDGSNFSLMVDTNL